MTNPTARDESRNANLAVFLSACEFDFSSALMLQAEQN
jgi:hypothetical protein